MIGSGMREQKDGIHSFSILLISSKNQYMFKLSSRDRRQLLQFKDEVTKIAKSLVETGEIYNPRSGKRFKANPFAPFILDIIAKGGILNCLS